MDEMTRFQNAYNQLLAMGFEDKEIRELLNNSKSEEKSITHKEAIDAMVLYFRAKKMLSQPHVKEIIRQNEQLRGSSSCPRDVATLFAYETFVDTLDHVEILRGVGSGSREVSRTWENYFAELEAKYQKDLKNKGNGTRRQVETLADIQEDPFDYRLRAYLEQFMDEQVRNDVAFAINMDPSAYAVVKGIPFMVGKNKQESYADVVLKYLYANTSISRERAENLKLESLNRELRRKLAETTTVTGKISETELALLGALSTMSTDVLSAVKASTSEVQIAVQNAFNGTMGAIITNGRARKSEHEALGREVRDTGRRLAEQIAGESEARRAEHAGLSREIADGNDRVLGAIDKLPGSGKVMGAVVTNGRARKNEHNKILSAIKHNRVVTAVASGALAVALIAGMGLSFLAINRTPSNENQANAYYQSEAGELDAFTDLYNGAVADGIISQEELDSLNAARNQYASTDIAGQTSHTASMDAMISVAETLRQPSSDQVKTPDDIAFESFSIALNRALANDGVVSEEEEASLYDMIASLNASQSTKSMMETLLEATLVEDKTITETIEKMPESLIAFNNAGTTEEKVALYEAETDQNVKYVMEEILDLIREQEESAVKDNFFAELGVAYGDGTLSEAEISALKNNHYTVGKGLSEDQQTINRIIDTFERNLTLESDLALMNTQIITLTNANEALTGDLKTAKDALAEAETAKEALTTSYNKLQAEKDALQELYDNLLQNPDIDNAQLEELKNQIKTLEEELATAETALEEANAKIAEVEEKLATAEKLIETITAENTKLKGEVDTFIQQVEAAEALNASLQGQVTDLQSTLSHAEVTIKALTETNEDLQARLDELQDLYDELLATAPDSEELTKLQAQITEMQQKLDEANATIDSLEQTVEALTTENSGLKDENAGLTTENAGLKDENAGLKDENAGIKDQLGTTIAEKDKIAEQLKEVQVYCEQLEASQADNLETIATLQAKIAELENSGASQEEINALTAQLEAVKTQLASSQTTLNEARQSVKEIYIAFGYTYTEGMTIEQMMADIFYDLGIDYNEDTSENEKDNPTFGG